MRIARRIVTGLFATVLSGAIIALAVRIYMSREVEDRVAPGEETSITQLRSPLPRASFIACPPAYCSTGEAIPSPIFELPWERLYRYWVEIMSAQEGLVSAVSDRDARRFIYIQHSPVLRFPDVITVEFVPLAVSRSSIAIYSRSRYGEYDFRKNRKRVERWLALLQKLVRPDAQRRGAS